MKKIFYVVRCFSRATFFLYFVDRATAVGGVAAVIKNGVVIWIYKRRIMYIMYSLGMCSLRSCSPKLYII